MEAAVRAIEVSGGDSDDRRYKQDQGESATRARAADDKVRSKVEAPRPKKTTKLGYKDQRELDQLPARIDALAAEAAALEQKLADPALYNKDTAGFAQLTAALAGKRTELTAAEARWRELESAREALEKGPHGELTARQRAAPPRPPSSPPARR